MSTIPKEPLSISSPTEPETTATPASKTYVVNRLYWDRLLYGSGGQCPVCGMNEARVCYEQTKEEIDAGGNQVRPEIRYKTAYSCDECFGRRLMLTMPKGSARTLFEPPPRRTEEKEADDE